jgi:acetolactate decarboxylase
MTPVNVRKGLALLISIFVIVAIMTPVLAGCGQEENQQGTEVDRETLFQVSTLGALSVGVYDGATTYGEVEKHGDMGLGTFQGLDGEMVAVDGEFFQVKTDGVAYPVEDSALAPFAVVTFFDSDREGTPEEGLDYEGLQAFIDALRPSSNIFYAIRIDGEFEYVKARSVPGQEKPYPPLSEVVEEQTVFEFNTIEGTMVGFWCPSYVGGINASGYHLHFLTAEKEAGGHVLDLRLGEVTVYLDETPDLFMQLPETEEFMESDLDT